MLSLLIKKKRGAIENIEFDAVLREIHNTRSVITDHPVEVGANITDHVRIEPERVQITGVVTNTPLSYTSIALGPRRSEEAYERLKALQVSATLVKVVTTLRDYDNMVIESIDVSRDKDTGGAIFVDITLKRIFKADSKKINVPNADKPAAAKVNKGTKPTKAVTPEKNISTIAKGQDALGWGFTK